jgi:hypothetical protein
MAVGDIFFHKIADPDRLLVPLAIDFAADV